MNALIIGCGYLGQRVARAWRDAGHEVRIVTRSPEQATQFQAEGFLPIVADVTDPDSLTELPAADCVLFAVGYDRNSSQSIDEVYAGGVRNVLAALPRATGRFIYISTTGVYGDAGGDWIDEHTPTAPTRAGGVASLAAENALRESHFASRAVILRLAGIYGPGRLPYLQQLQAGEPIAAPQAGHLNLIYVDDAARVVQQVAAPEFTFAGPLIYCVSDGHPIVRGDYYCAAARLLGAPEPQFAEPPAGSPRAARATADKRVSNQKLLKELRFDLLYPTYADGLQQILGDIS